MFPLLAAAAIPEFFKIGTSISQRKKAKQFEKTKRPAYEIPGSYKTLLDATKYESSISGVPGQGQIENKLAESSAAGMQGIRQSGRSPSAMLAAISALDKNTKDATVDLGVEGANYRAGQQGKYYNALDQMGQQEFNAWEWDKKNPYLSDMAAASAYRNASQANMMGGLEGLGNVAQTGIIAGMNKAPGQPAVAGGGTPNYYPSTQFDPNGQAPYSQNAGNPPYSDNGYGQGMNMFMQTPDDQWTMYQDHMRKAMPFSSDEVRKQFLPKYLSKFINGG